MTDQPELRGRSAAVHMASPAEGHVPGHLTGGSGSPLAGKVMPADEAAAFIAPGNHVGMSGFTGFGHPKAVPAALVRRAGEAAARGDRFAVSVWTGSSTAPELDGALAAVDSHVDHTEHGVHVIITEQGVADLRGLPPRRRAQKIIDQCAHPVYRPALQDYLDRATATAPGKHTPHLLGEALSWHVRYLQEGTMRSA